MASFIGTGAGSGGACETAVTPVDAGGACEGAGGTRGAFCACETAGETVAVGLTAVTLGGCAGSRAATRCTVMVTGCREV